MAWEPTLPYWVRPIKAGKGHPMTAAAKLVLEGLWFCAEVNRGQGPRFSGPVSLGRHAPTIAELAERNGLSPSTTKKALALVISLGWARRDGRDLRLAWLEPHAFGSADTGHPGSRTRSPEYPMATPVTATRVTDEATRVTARSYPGDRDRLPGYPNQLTTPDNPKTTPLTPAPPKPTGVLGLKRIGDGKRARKPETVADTALTHEHIAAIDEVGGQWGVTWRNSDRWIRALTERIAEDGITPIELAAMLRRHDEQSRIAKGEGRLHRAHVSKGDDHIPEPPNMWNRSWQSREWRKRVRADLEAGAALSKPGEPTFASQRERQLWLEAETEREHAAFLATLPPDERANLPGEEYEW